MTIDSIETVFLTCIFIVPGFIIDGIVNAFCPPPKRNEAVHFLYFLVYGVLHCAVYSWAYLLIWSIKSNYPIWFILGMFGITFVGAAFLGIIIGLFRSKELFRKLLNKCNCNISGAIPTAWDNFFSRQIYTIFVSITLMDNTRIYGYYGKKSSTSSDPNERDIYLEKVYEVTENGEWIEHQQNGGVYIPKDQIKIIEFIKGGQNNEKGE